MSEPSKKIIVPQSKEYFKRPNLDILDKKINFRSWNCYENSLGELVFECKGVPKFKMTQNGFGLTKINFHQDLKDPNPEVMDKDFVKRIINHELFVDDFMWASTETGECGLGWLFTNGSLIATNNAQYHYGIITRRSGTTASQVASMYPGDGVAVTMLRRDEFEWIEFIVAAVATDADHKVRFGLIDNVSYDPPYNGIYFERLAADTNWYRVTSAYPNSSRTDTGIAYDTSWHKFKIVANGDYMDFWIDDVFIGKNTLYIPAASTGLIPFFQIVPTTTTARDLKIDNFKLQLKKVSR